MSRILSRKMNKTPVRSPSPDIAHKNIIVRTASPLTDALKNLRMSRTSKNPLGRGFGSSQQYEAYIQTLQEKIKQFSVQNSILQHENENKTKEIQFLKQMNFNYRKEASSRSVSRASHHQHALSDYEAKIKELSEQVKRVHEILVKDRSKIEQLEIQNETLRNRNTSMSSSRLAEERRISLELIEIQKKLNYEFNQRLSEYQEKVQLVLQAEAKKLNKVEKDQRLLQKELQLSRNYGSPATSNKSKEKFNSTSYQSPSNDEKRYEEMSVSRHVDCQKCRIHLLRIAELEAELNVKNFNTTSSKSKSGTNINTVPKSVLEDYLQKLQEIKIILNNEEIEELINHIQSNLNDIFNIQEKLEYMKQQKNAIIQQLREKQVQQSLEIVRLKKQNEIFRNQLTEQLEEIQKLKEQANNAKSNRKDEPTTKRRRQTNQGNILRRYIVQAIERIQNLESQIGDTLRS